MQPYGLSNIIAEQFCQGVCARLLVQVVDALLREIDIVANEQVTQIVEQCCDHQRIAKTAFRGEVGRLQRMFLLGDG